jgi:hypothetical protein
MKEQEKQQIAILASVITAEFYRSLLIQTLLSSDEVINLIVKVAIECDYTIEADKLKGITGHNIIQLARNEFFRNHNIKL